MAGPVLTSYMKISIFQIDLGKSVLIQEQIVKVSCNLNLAGKHQIFSNLEIPNSLLNYTLLPILMEETSSIDLVLKTKKKKY